MRSSTSIYEGDVEDSGYHRTFSNKSLIDFFQFFSKKRKAVMQVTEKLFFVRNPLLVFYVCQSFN